MTASPDQKEHRPSRLIANSHRQIVCPCVGDSPARCVTLCDDRRVAASDIYQSFLYAYAGSRDLPAALLLYPATAKASQPVHLQVRGVLHHAGAEIVALGVPIPAALREIRERRRGPVLRSLSEVIRHFTLE